MLVNRREELDTLKRILNNSDGSVVIINGAAGIGKTYLSRYYAEISKKMYSWFGGLYSKWKRKKGCGK